MHFSYEAFDAKANKQEGVVEATSMEDAARLLREKGQFVVSVAEKNATLATSDLAKVAGATTSGRHRPAGKKMKAEPVPTECAICRKTTAVTRTLRLQISHPESGTKLAVLHWGRSMNPVVVAQSFGNIVESYLPNPRSSVAHMRAPVDRLGSGAVDAVEA